MPALSAGTMIAQPDPVEAALVPVIPGYAKTLGIWLDADDALRPGISLVVSHIHQRQRIHPSSSKKRSSPPAWEPRSMQGAPSMQGIAMHNWRNPRARLLDSQGACGNCALAVPILNSAIE